MNDDQHDQLLFARFGTSSPCWRLSSDSNALELMPETEDDAATVAIALSGAQAAQIRRLTGVTSLISACALFLYFRYAKFITHKKWIIVPGFVLSAFISFWMTRLTPQASEAWLIPPLLLRGLLLLFIVLPVANLTFRIFAIEEFTHGYRLKNIVRQLTISFATATVIIVEQHRLALHQTRLAEFVNPFNPAFQNTYAALTHSFELMGRSAGEAHGLALAEVSRMVAQQASFLSSLDGFYFLIGVAVCGGIFAAWQKQID